MTLKEMTNAQFAVENKAFKAACMLASVEPTPRQASKYRQKKGIAYKFKKHPETKYLQRQVELNKANSPLN